MRSKLKELQETLVDFIEQDRYSVLIVRLTEPELPYAIKMIETLDQREQAHLFGLFTEPAVGDDNAYASAVLASLRAQLDPVNQLRVADGQKPWPPFPARCEDQRLSATHRLRAGIAHAASLVDGGPEHHFAASLLPHKIENHAAYAASVAALLPPSPHPAEPGWRRVRLILRDDGANPVLIDKVRREKNPDVLVYEPDLSPPAMMDGMAADVADPALPEPARMQTLTELACVDMAYGRFPEAMAKYEIAYDYFRRHQMPVMQAFVLQGVGDVLRRTQHQSLAKERYAQGLTLALTTDSLVLILGLAYAVGDVSLELMQFEDAEGHLDIARRIAGSMQNRAVEADALEKQGMAQLGQGQRSRAIGALREAATASRAAQYRVRLDSVLDRLTRVYADAGMFREQRECEDELRRLRAGAPIVPREDPDAANCPPPKSSAAPSRSAPEGAR
jgi:tetratricopeptide (TPR) repeat protein